MPRDASGPRTDDGRRHSFRRPARRATAGGGVLRRALRRAVGRGGAARPRARAGGDARARARDRVPRRHARRLLGRRGRRGAAAHGRRRRRDVPAGRCARDVQRAGHAGAAAGPVVGARDARRAQADPGALRARRGLRRGGRRADGRAHARRVRLHRLRPAPLQSAHRNASSGAPPAGYRGRRLDRADAGPRGGRVAPASRRGGGDAAADQRDGVRRRGAALRGHAAAAGHGLARGAARPPRGQGARGHARRRRRNPWTLDALASAAALSRSALHERFAQLVGMPPMHYLAQWRMQVAAGLLRSTDASVASVALDVGYESEAAFSRAFKRLVGAPPAAWRRTERSVSRSS